MQSQFILIDFENVQPAALASVAQPGLKVYLFAGAGQSKVPYELAEPSARFYIVSNDKGFDPLIEHLKAQKIVATRINDLSQIGAKRAAPKAGEDRTAVVIAQLRGLNGNKPRTIKTLSNAIGAMFQKQLAPEEIASIVQALQRTGRIAVKDNKVAYLLR